MKCYSIYRSTLEKCPICGTAAQKTRQEIEEVEGQLVEFTKRMERTEQGRAQDLDSLIAIAKSRKYKYPVAWAKHVLNGRRK